ncbi:hypothetical protein [Streptomyces cremeus]|uniref:NAD-dependent epimerase/dehydratase domain-containing protein n=1 Tax=Streptomyces cremeus TaxID=66881 RepID=A0ABV5P922_STRCM
MRAVVTGGAGFIGSHLCGRPLDAGCEGVGCSVGCLRHPQETLRARFDGTRHAPGPATAKGARSVLVSASGSHGDTRARPESGTYRGEVDPAGPRSRHEEAKRFAGVAVTAYRTVYGTHAAGTVQTFGPFDSWARSLCSVGELVDGVLKTVRPQVRGVVGPGGPDELSALAPAAPAAGPAGSSATAAHIPSPGDGPRRRRPGIAPARTAPGRQPAVSVEEGPRRTVDRCAAHRVPELMPVA